MANINPRRKVPLVKVSVYPLVSCGVDPTFPGLYYSPQHLHCKFHPPPSASLKRRLTTGLVCSSVVNACLARAKP
jgi:hypothetical protein